MRTPGLLERPVPSEAPAGPPHGGVRLHLVEGGRKEPPRPEHVMRTEVDRTRLLFAQALLEEVEAQDDEAEGELMVSSSATQGTIFVRHKRVCWVQTPGMGPRLTELFIEESEESPSETAIREVYEQCRRNAQPLGDALLERGILRPPGLRSALLRHSAESLARLCSHHDLDVQWTQRTEGDFRPRYTFAAPELLVAATPLALRAEAVEADDDLRSVIGDREDVTGVAFDGDPELPPALMAQVNGEPLGLRALMELGGWLKSLWRAGLSASDSARVVVGTSPSGAGVVVWRRGPCLLAVLSTEATFLRRAMGRVAPR